MEPLAITKTHYSIQDFLEWQNSGTLDLNPRYQRRSVWNEKIKSLLLDSIVKGFPIPLIFLHNRRDTRTSKLVRQVVDGQQRLRTILSFIEPGSLTDFEDRDDFTILKAHNKELAGVRFHDLPDTVQQTILQTSISVNILPPDVSDVTVLQIFQRMNTTGLKLTPQEVRNGTWFGEFKDLSYALAYEQNQRWTQWSLFDQQKVAQMAEVEFTSDLLGALLRGVSGSSAQQLNALYKDYDQDFWNKEWAADEFRHAFDVLAPIFDNRLETDVPKRFRSTSWFYALFAVVTALKDAGPDADPMTEDLVPDSRIVPSDIDPALLLKALERLDVKISTKGALSEDLAESLKRQTTHKASRVQKIRLIRDELQS